VRRVLRREKKPENCAYCSEYACGKLETISRTETTARKCLDAIRSGILEIDDKDVLQH